ncbi:MAG: glycosyltransferase, partial [Ferrovibrio sp.]
AWDKPALLPRIMRWLFRAPFALVICTRDGSGGDTWLPRLLHPLTPFRILLNGVDPPVPGHAMPDLDRLKDRTLVTFVGRLDPVKNLRMFVEGFLQAARQEPALHAVIAGDGIEQPWLEQRLAEGGSQAITYMGALPHQNVPSLLARSDIYVSLNTMGNLSNANLEAIRSGCCMILPAADPLTGKDTDTSVLLPPDTAVRIAMTETALAEALLELHRDPTQRRLRATRTAEVGATFAPWPQRITEELLLVEKAGRQADSTSVTFLIADLAMGGAQRVLSLIAGDLARRGFRVTVVTLAREPLVVRLPESVTLVRLDLANTSKGILSSLYWNLRRILAVRQALLRTRSHTVVSLIGTTNILAVLASLKAPWRLVISERNDPNRQSLGRGWDRLRRICYRHADLVTTNSAVIRDGMAQWIPTAKLALLRNPLPPQAFPALVPQHSRQQVILAVGRLHPQKGFDILLRAFARLHTEMPSWRLVFAGTGPLETKLRSQAEDLGISQAVDWLGHVENLTPVYARSAIFALPSRHEGTPNALLEAMAAGCTCIVSDTSGGALELIAHSENGLIVRSEDPMALGEALGTLCADGDLRDRLGQNARKTAERHNLDSVTQEWLHLLRLPQTAGFAPGASEYR